MIGWTESGFLAAALMLACSGVMRRFRFYRSLLLGSATLMLISAIYPRRGNVLGQYLFGGLPGTMRLPTDMFGVAWWLLGAWLVNGLLELVLRKTLFPDDNQPHARRLFADLASVLIYVLAIVGIMDTVLKQPISAVLATSGVLAIVLGLALQNTLADVFSGLAINVERSFGAGEWITLLEHVEGQVIQVNWRATRIRTAMNDMIVIPNSVMAKAIVTNHSRLSAPRVIAIELTVTNKIAPARVLAALEEAARGSTGMSPTSGPKAYSAYSLGFSNAVIRYELDFPVDEFTRTASVQSAVVQSVADVFQSRGIPIGAPETSVRILSNEDEAVPLPPPQHPT